MDNIVDLPSFEGFWTPRSAVMAPRGHNWPQQVTCCCCFTIKRADRACLAVSAATIS